MIYKILPILFLVAIFGYEHVTHLYQILLPSIIIALIYIRKLNLKDQTNISFIRLIIYGLYLVKEITFASITTAKIIISPKINISPTTSWVNANIDDTYKVIYANSITLTPGTISILVENNKILVHALQPSYIDDLNKEIMLEKIEKIKC